MAHDSPKRAIFFDGLATDWIRVWCKERREGYFDRSLRPYKIPSSPAPRPPRCSASPRTAWSTGPPPRCRSYKREFPSLATSDYFLAEPSGCGRIGARSTRCQLPDDKFLKDIGGGSRPNPDGRVFERQSRSAIVCWIV